MSRFPAIKPASRSFSMPAIPVTSFQAMSGREVRIATGSAASGAKISLGFQNLLEATASQILSHFNGQSGVLQAFDLPPAVWAGWTAYESYFSATTKFRYTNPPSVKSVAPGIMDITVELVSLLE